MMWLFLLACTPSPEPPPTHGTEPTGSTASTADTAPPEPWRSDERYVAIDELATFVALPEEFEYNFGQILATGADLDKDGRLEWSTGANPGNEYGVIRTYEGTEVIAERHPRDGYPFFAYNFPTAATHADLDGDGFGDLLFSYNWGYHGRLQAVTGVDEASDGIYAIDLGLPKPSAIGTVFQLTTGPSGEVVATWSGLSTRGVSSFPTGLFGSGGTIEEPVYIDRQSTLWLQVPGDGDGDGIIESVMGAVAYGGVDGARHLLVGSYHTRDGLEYGEVWICPDGLGLALDPDCTLIDTAPDLGFYQAAFDLDGDGTNELGSGGVDHLGVWHGALTVYEADGTPRASISGYREASVGGILVGEDAEGTPWLLTTQLATYTHPAAVYAFRGTDVVGDLTEDDADVVYYLDTPGRVFAYDIYQETPDADPQLLIGTGGGVYMIPFAPADLAR